MSVNAVRAHLVDDSTLESFVGERIYRNRIPQKAIFPAILFNATDDPQNGLDGSTFGSHFDFDFEIYAPTFELADSVAAALNSALSSSSVFSSLCSGVADDDFIDETNNYSIFLDYSIWF